MQRRRVTICWNIKDRDKRRKICDYFGCKYAATINWFSDMDILPKDWDYFLSGEEKGLYDIRNFKKKLK